MFAGEGTDINGILGRPTRILTILNKNEDLIVKSKVKIRVIVNEYEKEKYDLLVQNLESIENKSLYSVEYYTIINRMDRNDLEPYNRLQ